MLQILEASFKITEMHYSSVSISCHVVLNSILSSDLVCQFRYLTERLLKLQCRLDKVVFLLYPFLSDREGTGAYPGCI